MSTLTRMPRTQLLAAMAVVILVAELFANAIISGNDADVGGWIGLSAFGIAVMLLLVLVAVPGSLPAARALWTLGLGVDRADPVRGLLERAALRGRGRDLRAARTPATSIPGESGPAPASAGVIVAALATVVAFVLCIVG